MYKCIYVHIYVRVYTHTHTPELNYYYARKRYVWHGNSTIHRSLKVEQIIAVYSFNETE